MFHHDPLLQDLVSLQPATALFVLNELRIAQGLQITGVDLEVRLYSQRGFQNIFEGTRRGKQHKRTSKSLLLTLLEYYLYIIQFAGDASGHAAPYVRRQTQISDTWNAVKYNRWFPRQGDPLLLRGDGISRRKKTTGAGSPTAKVTS